MVASVSQYRAVVDSLQYLGSSNVADVMAHLNTLLAPETCSLTGNVISCFIGDMNPTDWLIYEFGPATFLLGGNTVTFNTSPRIVTNAVFHPCHMQEIGAADTIALGVNSVPTLLGAAQATVQVAIKPTFADTNYQATAVVTGAVNLLASLSVLSVTVVNGTRVDVVVRNTGLLSLSGASVLVSAIHN